MFTLVHDTFGSLSRKLWHVPGWHRVARRTNQLLLSLGSDPLRRAPLKDGTRFIVDLRAHTEWHSFYSGEYDDLWVSICKSGMLPGELFLDVGGNIGIYSIRVATVMPKGCTAYPFEPFPPNAERLNENVKLNGLNGKVILKPFGLSDCKAEMSLTLREDFQAGSKTGNASISISEETDGDFEKTIIRVDRLDDIRGELADGPIGVIKVDIEGHEDQFFHGGAASIAADRPIIVAESCKHYYRAKGISLRDVFTASIPDDYVFYRESAHKGRLAAFTDFESLAELENIVLAPPEKLDRLSAFL